MIDENNFLSLWVGQRSMGHILIFKSEKWKLESIEKLPSERVVELMVGYLHGDLSLLKKIQ